MTMIVADRTTATAATGLLDLFGDEAAIEAARLAAASRDRGNMVKFCHWRQVERLIVAWVREPIHETAH